jgi:hypothetical protein
MKNKKIKGKNKYPKLSNEVAFRKVAFRHKQRAQALH